MKSFVLVAVLVTVAALCVSGGYFKDPIYIHNRFDLIRRDLEPEYKSDLPKVYGAKSCGGSGKFISFRVKSCARDSICRIPADGKARPFELEFIPSVDTKAVGLRLILMVDGSAKPIYERAIADSTLQAGKRFILTSSGGALDELKGKTITAQTIIYKVDDNNVEVCAESSYEIF